MADYGSFLLNIFIGSLAFSSITVSFYLKKKDIEKYPRVFLILSFFISLLALVFSITEYRELISNTEYIPSISSLLLIISIIFFFVGVLLNQIKFFKND